MNSVFLQRIINGVGRIEREMAVGSGCTDLVIYFNDEVFVLELKVNHNIESREEGLEQLDRYTDTLGTPKAYLILFEKKLSKEMAWENRIKWNEITYNNKQITVVEM